MSKLTTDKQHEHTVQHKQRGSNAQLILYFNHKRTERLSNHHHPTQTEIHILYIQGHAKRIFYIILTPKNHTL